MIAAPWSAASSMNRTALSIVLSRSNMTDAACTAATRNFG